MSLGIYDKTIAGILALLEPFDGRKLPLDKGLSCFLWNGKPRYAYSA